MRHKKYFFVLVFLLSNVASPQDELAQLPMIVSDKQYMQKSLQEYAFQAVVKNVQRFSHEELQRFKHLLNTSPILANYGTYTIYHIGPYYHQKAYKESHSKSLAEVHYNTNKPWIFGCAEQQAFPIFIKPTIQYILFNIQTKEKRVLHTREKVDFFEGPQFVFWNNYYSGFDLEHFSYEDEYPFCLYNITNRSFSYFSLPRAETYNINQVTPYIFMTHDNLFVLYSLIHNKIKTDFCFHKNEGIHWVKDIGPSEYLIQAGNAIKMNIYLFNTLHHTLSKINPEGYCFSSCSPTGFIAWRKDDIQNNTTEFLITNRNTPLVNIPSRIMHAHGEILDEWSTYFKTYFLSENLLLLIVQLSMQKNERRTTKEYLKVLNCDRMTLHNAHGKTEYVSVQDNELMDFSHSVSNLNKTEQKDYLHYLYKLQPELEDVIIEHGLKIPEKEILYVYNNFY